MNEAVSRRIAGALTVLLVCLALVAAAAPAVRAGEAPADDGGSRLAGPESAPNPPAIGIVKQSSSSIALWWEHTDQTATVYQVWRSTSPYFNPNAGQGVKIDQYTFPGTLYGLGTGFSYVDDGACGYFLVEGSQPKPCTAQSPTVQVLGDVSRNYFWVLRAGNADGEFDFENRVGEFDFPIIPDY